MIPRIAAVVITYNSADVLGDCLRSLAETKDVEMTAVVVADNASKDGSLAIAAAATEVPVVTVEMGRNAGYAAAINAGIAALDTEKLDAVMVLNPDCSVRPDTLFLLWEALRRPGFGIAAPRLVNPDGSLQPTLRRRPTLGRALAEAVLGKLAGRFAGLGELVTGEREHAEPGPAAWATGAALLISVEAMNEIGPWDESFLLYSEETEFILRAADRGWRLWYEPAAEVEHVGGESGTNPTLAALLIVNKVKLFRQRHGAITSAAYYTVVLFGESARALAGRRISRAAVVALVRPSRRLKALAG